MIILEFILIVFIAGKYVLAVKTKDITSEQSGIKVSDSVVIQSVNKDFYNYNTIGKSRRRNSYIVR